MSKTKVSSDSLFSGGEAEKIRTENKPKVAFICVHNSCRSQIAQALGKLYADDVFESYSAGTEIKDDINPRNSSDKRNV